MCHLHLSGFINLREIIIFGCKRSVCFADTAFDNAWVYMGMWRIWMATAQHRYYFYVIRHVNNWFKAKRIYFVILTTRRLLITIIIDHSDRWRSNHTHILTDDKCDAQYGEWQLTAATFSFIQFKNKSNRHFVERNYPYSKIKSDGTGPG